MLYCQYCGNPTKDEDNFCRECGRSTAHAKTMQKLNKKENTKTECPKCGYKVLITDVYCEECGTRLKPEGSDRKTTDADEPQPSDRMTEDVDESQPSDTETKDIDTIKPKIIAIKVEIPQVILTATALIAGGLVLRKLIKRRHFRR